MSLAVLLSQPILFVPESTTQTTHTDVSAVPVSASTSASGPPRRLSPDSEKRCVSTISSLLSSFPQRTSADAPAMSPLSRSPAIALSGPQGSSLLPSSSQSASLSSHPAPSSSTFSSSTSGGSLGTHNSHLPLPPSLHTSSVSVSRSPAIALSVPQDAAGASAAKASSSSSSQSTPSSSAFLSSTSGGRASTYETSSSVPTKRGYSATELSRPQDAAPIKRRRVSEDELVGILPPKQRVRLQARGLRNRSGVHCYRNASLQALGHIPQFRRLIQKHSCGSKGCMACCLRGAFCGHWRENGAKYPPHEPKALQAIAQSVGRSFARGNRQEDAHEYISLLLDRLSERSGEDCPRNVKGAITEIFGASKVSEVKCVTCKKVTTSSSSDDLVVMLTLPRGNPKHKKTSLEDCLREYGKTESIGDYKCEHCGCFGIEKSATFVAPPRVALMALGRFSWDGRKDNREVSFPEVLEWDEAYAQKGARPSRLAAVICHQSATISSGHYYAIVNAGQGEWLKYDDGRVSRCRSPTEDQEKRAYLLLYSQEGSGARSPVSPTA